MDFFIYSKKKGQNSIIFGKKKSKLNARNRLREQRQCKSAAAPVEEGIEHFAEDVIG